MLKSTFPIRFSGLLLKNIQKTLKQIAQLLKLHFFVDFRMLHTVFMHNVGIYTEQMYPDFYSRYKRDNKIFL